MEINMLWLYLLGIFIITILIIIMYIRSEKLHNLELKKINGIENKIKIKQQLLKQKRDKTIECPFKNLNDPRSCYFQSDYTCSWNEETERCEKK